MKKSTIIAVFLVAVGITELQATSYENPIAEVDCSALNAVVTLSKKSFLWSYAGGSDTNQPIIFGHLENNTDCEFAVPYILPGDGFSIGIKNCSIQIYTTFDDNGPSNYFYSFVALAKAGKIDDSSGYPVEDPAKTLEFRLSISCLFGARGDVGGSTGPINGTGGGSGGNGGDGTGVSEFVQLNFTMADGSPTHSPIYAGDRLTIAVSVVGETYSSLLPIDCKFSADKAGNLGFSVINNGCPLSGVIENNEDIHSISRVDLRNYTTSFTAFTVVDADASDLWYTCRVRLCINDTLCDQSCWDTTDTGGNLRWWLPVEDRSIVMVSGRFGGSPRQTLAEENVEGTARNAIVVYRQQSGYTSLPTWLVVVLILVGVLCIFGVLIGLVCCLCCGAGAGWLWRRKVEDPYYTENPVVLEGPTVISVDPEDYHKMATHFD